MTDTDTDEFTCVHCGSDLAARAGEGLDVERLARALCANRWPMADAETVFVDDECRGLAGTIAREYAALYPDTDETAYPGQHDDCIATVPHFHARPYQTGEYDKGNDDQRRKDEGETWKCPECGNDIMHSSDCTRYQP